MVLISVKKCGTIQVQNEISPHNKGLTKMTTQLHIRLNKTLLSWIIKKAKSENRTINNFVVTSLMNLKKEKENDFMGTKNSQASKETNQVTLSDHTIQT